jgi:ATP-dependent RNA helicase A
VDVQDVSDRDTVIIYVHAHGECHNYVFLKLTKQNNYYSYETLEAHSTPEILRTPLHEIALSVKLLRLGSIGDFLAKAMQPPSIDTVVECEVLLRGGIFKRHSYYIYLLFIDMNALDVNSELTPLGRILARLPIEPTIGRSIVLSAVFL